jgi:hypothetical protein
MLLRAFATCIALAAATGVGHAEIDCRIRAMPPSSFTSKPLPEVQYKGMPLAELQKVYRRFAGLPARASGLDYCADPLGFVYPWNMQGTPTIYYPTDVTDRCQREVIEHEQAHVRGWPLDHPGARLQTGPCKAKSTWPKTVAGS